METEAPESKTEADLLAEASPFSRWVYKNRLVWMALFIFVGVGSDQVTKVWAQNELSVYRTQWQTEIVDGEAKQVEVKKYLPRRPMVIIPKFFNFRYAENNAAAFSLTRSLPEWFRMPFLVVVTLIAIAFIMGWYFRMRYPDGILLTAFAFITAGALGNFIDRVRMGYVIDFVDMYAGFINMSWPHWPTYNIADMCIVAGAGLVIFRTIRPMEEQAEPPAQEKGLEESESAS
jgi:signal peptidase II